MKSHDSHRAEASPPHKRRRVVWRCRRGASMVEYAIIVILIGIVAFGAFQGLGNTIEDVLADGEGNALFELKKAFKFLDPE